MYRRNRHIRATSLTVAGALLAAVAAGPVTAAPISSKFDGTYTGSRELVKPLSGDQCGGPERYTVKIHNGMIDGTAMPAAMGKSGKAEIKGIVTSDGFFTGKQEIGPKKKSLVQGRIEGKSMVGGLFTKGGSCAWVMDLDKA